MVKKTSSKTPQKTIKKTAKAAKSAASGWFLAPRKASSMNDLKTAVLLVSLTINAAIFITWLILRLTTMYDQQVFNFLFVR